MGIGFAVVIAVVTLVIAFLISFADGMSDAPTQEGTSPVPVLVIGAMLVLLCIFTHYHPIHFHW